MYMKFSLRLLYLYLFSFVGLLIVVIASIQMVNLGLKTFIFTDADTYEIFPESAEKLGLEDPQVQIVRQQREVKRNRQRELVNSIAMIVVGAPLYLYHWGIIKKEAKD